MLFSDRLLVRTAKADIAVPYGAIKHVAVSTCRVIMLRAC